MPPKKPTRQKNKERSELESDAYASGICHLAGVDEVGRGCLAGPVVAACVIFSPEIQIPDIQDSKLLTPTVRERLYTEIEAQSVAWAVAELSSTDIDKINIHQASLLAMKRAVGQLSVVPEFLLVDGKFPLDVNVRQQAVISGDARCKVIGAASIMAKVWRDRLMCALETYFPAFSFAQHKGYGTRQHREELRRHGPTEIHRRTFKGCE